MRPTRRRRPLPAVRVDGEHLAVGDHRPGDDSRATAAPSSDIDTPGEREVLRGFEMLHRMSGAAAGLRPVRITHRRRQRDVELGEPGIGVQLILDQQYRLALAGQRRRRGLAEPGTLAAAGQEARQRTGEDRCDARLSS